jgi:hypothetical protein
MRVATFVVELDGPDDYPSDEGSADALARLEMRAAREVETQLQLAVQSAALPDGFSVRMRREE